MKNLAFGNKQGKSMIRAKPYVLMGIDMDRMNYTLRYLDLKHN